MTSTEKSDSSDQLMSPKKKYNVLKQVFHLLSGLILLIGIVIWVGPEEIFSRFHALDWKWLLWVIPLYYANFLLGGIGMYSILPPSMHLPRKEFFKLYFFTQNMGTFLPFQIGETSLVFFLKQHKIAYSSSLIVFALDKVISLGVLLFVGTLSILIFFGEKIVHFRMRGGWMLGSLLMVVFLSGLLIMKHVQSGTLKNPLLRKFCQRITGIISELCWSFHHNKRGIFTNCLTTLFRRSLVDSLMKLVVLCALGVYPPFWKLILISNILAVISLIPITAQGIGVVEIGAMYVFSLIGLERDTAIALYLIARPVSFMLSGAFLGVCMMMKTINFRMLNGNEIQENIR